MSLIAPHQNTIDNLVDLFFEALEGNDQPQAEVILIKLYKLGYKEESEHLQTTLDEAYPPCGYDQIYE